MPQKLPSKSGFSDVLLGLQYGDEGKARVVDAIAGSYDVIARFNGGANAGHTIETEQGRLALQQVPSGVFAQKLTLYVGSGCAINIAKLAREIKNIEKLGIPLAGRLHVSSQASVIQPHHLLLDAALGKSVGTTKNGIGPCYADRAQRMAGSTLAAIRLGDFATNGQAVWKAIQQQFDEARRRFPEENLDLGKELEEMRTALAEIENYIEHDPLFLQKKAAGGAKVLFEGAQSVMLDVARGDVPFVTASHTVAAAAYVGGDLPVTFHRKTIGVAKAVMSRVGHGPFPSEFGGAKSEAYCMETKDGTPAHGSAFEATLDAEKLLCSGDEFEVGRGLRILSAEYGTVTGRPRRVGRLDLVQLSYAAQSNGVDELVLNKCDILAAFARAAQPKIPLVTAYELDGKRLSYPPRETAEYARVTPVVEYRPAFAEDISGVRQFVRLPIALKELVQEIESVTGCRVWGLGVGPKREEFIVK